MEEQLQTNIDMADNQTERSGIYTISNQLVNTSYNSLDDENSFELNECFICMEGEIEGHNPIKMTEITSITGMCKCEAWIHPSCYAEWVVKNMTCPICTLSVRFVDVDISEIQESRQDYEVIVENRSCTTQTKQNIFAAGSIFSFFVILITLIEVFKHT